MHAWVASAGALCDCPPSPTPAAPAVDAVDAIDTATANHPPAKRPRGRPAKHASGCRACWRSLAADRDLPPPHDLALATRCLHELRFERADVEEAAVVAALKVALPEAGFVVTDRLSAQLRLRDGTRTATTTSWTVWGWRDQRHAGAVFVAQSGVPYSGGGAFAAVAIGKGEWIGRYTGSPVPASVVRDDPACQAGYVKRIGGPYIDARDPTGRLRLADGTLADTHSFSHADWAALRMRGVAWEGAAQLSRFIQQAPLDVPANVVLRGSDVVATADIPEGGELFADYGGGRYWGKRLARGERVTCPICLEDECYLRKLERCAHCRQYTHASCLRAHVEHVRARRAASAGCTSARATCCRAARSAARRGRSRSPAASRAGRPAARCPSSTGRCARPRRRWAAAARRCARRAETRVREVTRQAAASEVLQPGRRRQRSEGEGEEERERERKRERQRGEKGEQGRVCLPSP